MWWKTVIWCTVSYTVGRFIGKYEQRNIDEHLLPALKALPKTLN